MTSRQLPPQELTAPLSAPGTGLALDNQLIYDTLGNIADLFKSPDRQALTPGAGPVSLPSLTDAGPFSFHLDHLAHGTVSQHSLNSQFENCTGAFQRGGKTFLPSVNGEIHGGPS